MNFTDAFRPPVVGVDLGSHSVKAVALRAGRSGHRLIAAGELAMPAGEQATHERVGELAGGLLDTLGLHRVRLACAVSGPSVVVKRLVLPESGRAELQEAIAREAEQHLRFAPGEVQFDSHIVDPGQARPAAAVDVLLAAARRDHVDQRLAVMAATGREPAVIDVEAFALANAYTENYPERSDALTALVHVGLAGTLVCVLEAGTVVLSRDVGVGGAAYVAALEREIGAAPADTRRILHGQPVDDPGVWQVLREVHLRLIEEVRTLLECHVTVSNTGLGRLVLSGGACRIGGLGSLLESECQMKVEWCDPFRGIVRPPDAVGHDLGGPAFAVAVGLSLRREGPR